MPRWRNLAKSGHTGKEVEEDAKLLWMTLQFDCLSRGSTITSNVISRDRFQHFLDGYLGREKTKLKGQSNDVEKKLKL